MPNVTVTFFPSAGTAGAEVHRFTLQSSLSLSAWREGPFSPGPSLGDVWAASKSIGSGWCIELELSARRAFYCDRVEITTTNGLARTILVGMVWPAARLITLRMGEELPMHPAWRRRRAKFGANELPLPTVDFGAQQLLYMARLSQLRAAIASRGLFQNEGPMDGITSWIGPFPLWGQRDPGPGAPGGTGIDFSTGWQGCPSFSRFALEASAVAISREWAFYNADGTLALPEQWLPGDQPEVRSEAGWKLPAWADVAPDPLPLPQSLSHASRIGRWFDAAWEMTGSPLARRGLAVLAQHALLELSDRGAVMTDPSNLSQNLATQEALSLLSPGQGLGWCRTHGQAAYRVAMAWKAGMRSDAIVEWVGRLAAAVQRSSMPSGACASGLTAHITPAYRLTHTFHEGLLSWGLRSACRQTGVAMPPCTVLGPQSLYRSAYPHGNYYGGIGPLRFPAVAPADPQSAPFQELTIGFGYPEDPVNVGDPADCQALFALLARDTGDVGWLGALTQNGRPLPTLSAQRAAMEAESEPIQRNMEAFALAALQEAGY